MNRIRSWALALSVLLALMVAAGNVAVADHVRVLVDVSVAPAAKAAQGYTLSVRLRTSDGKPVNEATVRFYEVVELFGRREMLVTTARTDGQGAGSTTYLPARTGRLELIARTSGRDHLPPVAQAFSLDAIVAAPPYQAAPVPLASFTALVPYGVGVVVLAVWALIAFALFGTALGIRRGRRDQQDIA